MPVNRLFVSQLQLDVWLSEGRITVDAETMVTVPEEQAFQLVTAVLFTSEVTGEPDAAALVGRVKDLEQLAEMGAEHYADSVILGDNAYEVVEGFAGTPLGDTRADASSSGPLEVADPLARLLAGP